MFRTHGRRSYIAALLPAVVLAMGADISEAKGRTATRHALKREVARNPQAALRPAFIRKAQAAGFRLPITVRLTRAAQTAGDDVLAVESDTGVVPFPLPAFQPPAAQAVTLDGKFSLELDFGADTSGYGQLGAIETIVANGATMTGTSFALADDNPPCVNGPATEPALRSGPATVTSAGATRGLLNPFGGTITGTLRLAMAVRSEVGTGCPKTYAQTPSSQSSQPVPVRFAGRFRVSPAITPDGKVRFGVMDVDDTVTAQVASFARITACTDTTSCAPEQFPVRVKLQKLTAELLVGGA